MSSKYLHIAALCGDVVSASAGDGLVVGHGVCWLGGCCLMEKVVLRACCVGDR